METEFQVGVWLSVRDGHDNLVWCEVVDRTQRSGQVEYYLQFCDRGCFSLSGAVLRKLVVGSSPTGPTE